MATDLDTSHLRDLAALRAEGAKVLSIYLDTEGEFGTARARKSEATSAVDTAARLAEEYDLDHEAKVAIREDIVRAREALAPDALDAKGASAVALFACGPAGLFDLVKLHQPVATQVRIDDRPWLAPLVRSAGEPRIAVALVNRQLLRLFAGTPHELEEVDSESLDLRPADDEEWRQHFRRAAAALLQLLKTHSFDLLVLDTRTEDRGTLLDALHPYVRDRVVEDELDLPDAETAPVSQVRAAAAEVCEKLHERRVDEALARLREGLGRGTRGAAGPEDVRSALEMRRVEILLYERGRDIAGLDDLVDEAVLQDAAVLEVDPDRHPELGPHQGIGAVLRF